MNVPSFFAELKRRNVYKVAIAYAVTGWAIAEGVSQVFPIFDVPNWALRLIVLLIVIGFPFALIIAWAFEITPEGIKRTEIADAKHLPQRRHKRAWIYFVALGGVVAIGLFLLGRYTASKGTAGMGSIEKSIAVLPFENLSDLKENAFFADGIQDELLAALSKIRDLKVISRTSVAGFRGRNLRDIARALGVANVVEGSVRGSTDRVRVTVQLIDARDDRHLWAQTYDRMLADSLTLQGELASEIADALRATLTPDEKARVQSKPTSNPEAYVFYLRGLQYAHDPDVLLQNTQLARQYLTEAVKLDPGFALAHARLSQAISFTYFAFEPTEQNQREARTEADTALQLQPNLGEGHLALGSWLYRVQRDYAGALQEFDIAARLLPNNSEAEYMSAAVLRRSGQWRESLARYLRAQELDPRNANIGTDVAFTYQALRDWDHALQTADRALNYAPESLNAKFFKAFATLERSGDVAAAQKVIATIPANVDPDGQVTLARWDLAMTARDFEASERILRDYSRDTFAITHVAQFPKSYFAACTALAKGDAPTARAKFELAHSALRSAVAEAPQDPWRHAWLGSVYAFLGRKEEAIAESRRATDLLPPDKDAVTGPELLVFAALIYAHVGEVEKAIDLIEHLLVKPSAVTDVGIAITLQELRLNPWWDPLRSDGRFQKIIAGPEPKTVY
jgi:TolB-like protein/Flp pilus assembly protein TadD